jgi:succinyl-CoA synthetase alpha subunit
MGIIVDRNTSVIVQGITGREGRFHALKMKEYGTRIAAGVAPGRGNTDIDGIPVFDTVKEAVEMTGADASVIFVPARFAPDAIFEAVLAGVRTIACISEGIPVHEMVKVRSIIKRDGGTRIGPNSPGIITTNEANLGIMPGNIFRKGPVGIITRSGTLAYEVISRLTEAGIGQTSCVGIGGDPVTGSSFTEMLELFRDDNQTEIVVLLGEIGGSLEEEAAGWLAGNRVNAVAFIAGRSAPEGKRMGHAGAIVSGTTGTAEGKLEAFRKAGVPTADNVDDLIRIVRENVLRVTST